MEDCAAAAVGRRGGRMVLSWPAPSISEGSGLACAVVPPAHPPTFLETGGLPVPPAGAAPPAPCLGMVASLRWRVWELPNLPLGTGAGTEGKERGGLWWRTPLCRPHHPPTFLGTGGLAVCPAGAAGPCTLLGNGGRVLSSLGAFRRPRPCPEYEGRDGGRGAGGGARGMVTLCFGQCELRRSIGGYAGH